MYGANERAIDGDPQTEVRYIRITDIDDHGKLQNEDWKTAKRVDEKYALDENDILFARSGATAGKTFIYKSEYGKAIFAGYTIRFRFDRTKVNPLFVFYYTLLSRYRRWVRIIQRPSGQPNINSREFKSFELPLAPLDIQNHIVEIMQSAYAQKRLKDQEADEVWDSIDDYVLAALKIEMPVVEEKKFFVIDMAEAIGRRIDSYYYQSKFRAVNQIVTSAWFDAFNLGMLISDVSSGVTPKVEEDYYTDSSGIPFLRVQNVTSQGIDLSDAKFIKREVHEGMLKRSQLQKDDLVFTITGRIGSTAVVPDNFEGNINQHSVRFHLKEQITNININPHYVAVFLNSELGRFLAIREVTGGTRPALDYKALKSLKVILPPIEVQNEIVAEAKQRFTNAKELRQEADAIVESAKREVEQILLEKEL